MQRRWEPAFSAVIFAVDLFLLSPSPAISLFSDITASDVGSQIQCHVVVNRLLKHGDCPSS